MSAPDLRTQMEHFQQWLEEHRDDPAVAAGWARIGRLLGGAG